MIRGARPYLALYALLFGAALAAGFRMTIPWSHDQLLDPSWLLARPGESLFHLHSQPPLLNAGLWVVLSLSRLTGLAPETLLVVAQFCLGLVLVVALADLFQGLLGPGRRAAAGMLFLLVNPMLYVSLLEFFYTAHELVLLVLFGAFARRFLASGAVAPLAGAAACLVALSNLHALWHALAALALLWGLVVLAPRAERPPGARGSRGAILALSAVLLAAWPLKNLAVFGFLGSTSCTGFNLANGLGVRYPPLAALFLRTASPPPPSLLEEAAALVPVRFHGVAALSRPLKGDGSPNWNHAAMIPLADEMLARAKGAVRARPTLLLERAFRNYRSGYTVFSGRHPLEGTLDWKAKGPASRRWLLGYERLAFLYFGDDTRAEPYTGLFLLVPLVLALAAAGIVRTWAERPVEARTALLLLAAAGWVLAIVLFVDGREGNRLRFPTDPFLVLLALWSLPAALGSRPGPTRPAPTP